VVLYVYRRHGIHRDLNNITVECNSSFFCILKVDLTSMKKKTSGNLSFCTFSRILPCCPLCLCIPNILPLTKYYSQFRKTQTESLPSCSDVSLCWILFSISFLLFSRKSSHETEVSVSLSPAYRGTNQPTVYVLYLANSSSFPHINVRDTAVNASLHLFLAI
jgi:hypothetical protein